jgi:hypothetical protein
MAQQPRRQSVIFTENLKSHLLKIIQMLFHVSRSMLLLLLTTTLSHNALGRPQADEEVKIITKPSPGEEYVLIHNGKTVIPAEHPKQVERDAVKGKYTYMS